MFTVPVMHNHGGLTNSSTTTVGNALVPVYLASDA